MERSLPACSLSGNRRSSSSMDSVVAVGGGGGGGGGGGSGGGGGGDIGVGFINPTPLASRCGKPCGSSSEALRSSWIQRLIPGVLGDFGGGGGGLSSSSCVRQSPEGGALCQSQAPAGGGGGQGQQQQQPLQDKQRLGHEVLGHGPDKVQGRDDEVQETRPLLLEGSMEQGGEGEREGEGHGHGHGSHGNEETGKESGFSRSCGLQTAESSQHFSRGNPRRWRLKPPVSPVEPSGWPAAGHKYYYAGRQPNMSSGKQEMWPTSSDAPTDMIVSGPCATVPTSAIGLRDSASDCAQFMDVEPQCAKEKEEEPAAGIACSQLNPLQQPVAREVYIGVKSYSVESHHPSVSSSFLPYRQWQGGQQSGEGGISRQVLPQGTFSQCGGKVSELSPFAAAAAGVSQLIQSQKAKQEVGTSHDYEKREGGATMVTDNVIKEKDATSFRSSPLSPLALFEPFKHVTKQQQRCGGKGKVDEGVSLLTPLFPPLSYLGIDDVPKDGVTGCPTERLDKHSSPVLTPVYEPYKQTGDHNGGSRTNKGNFADKSLVMTPILPSLKSPRDQNELSEGPSQCSSKTESLPPDVISPLDLDAYDSVNGREGISGQNSDTESKRHRGSSMCALQQSYNSSPVVMPVDQQIQPLHEHNDMGVRPLGFGFGRNIPHVPTASSRVKWLSNEQSPTPSPTYRTDYNNVIDRSRVVKDLSTTQSLELAKSSSTQGTGSHSKGPAGQPRHGHNTQLEVPIRDPRGFYFPLSEGSCGSNPLVPIADRSAGQHAPLFQPALSIGHTVSIRHLGPANRQPVYGRGSRLSVGLCGEAELQTQDLGQDDQGKREARMDFVKEEKEIGIAKRKGHPVVRMDKDLQQTGDGCDGTLLKKCTKVSPMVSEDLSLQPKEEDLPAGTLPEAEVPMEDRLQLPARAQAWLQRWMPLSKPAAGTVKPLRAMLDPKASLGGHQFSSIKTVIGSSVRAEPSLPEASKLHADGKSQHDLELQGSHSATEANWPACVKQANHNVEGSFGDDHRRPSMFGAGVPSAAALALLGVATRTDMP